MSTIMEFSAADFLARCFGSEVIIFRCGSQTSLSAAAAVLYKNLHLWNSVRSIEIDRDWECVLV